MKIFFICLLVLQACLSLAQDNIIQKDGTEIEAKVLEIGLENIKYKKYDNLEGATYVVAKKDIFMINYQNGTKDVFDTSFIPTPPKDAKKEKKEALPEEEPKPTPSTSERIDSSQLKALIPDSLRFHNYVFVNGGIKIGFDQFNSYYDGNRTTVTQVGFLGGFDLEIGNVIYIKPKTLSEYFAVGINMTWLQSGFSPESNVVRFPFTVNVGPQLSIRASRKSIIDLFVKPGVSIVYAINNFRPSLSAEMGCNFRYKSFMIGVGVLLMPTIYDSYTSDTQYVSSFQYVFHPNVAYKYSHFRLRIGAAIQTKPAR